MTNNDRSSVTRYLRRLLSLPEAGGLTDAQLLDRFVTDRDQAAFEVLVWRHGPKVLGVCRRMLHHVQDAEDAFQATFMILVRKASSIAQSQSLSSWLHRVAYRVALRAAILAQQRAARFKPLTDTLEAKEVQERLSSDLRVVLDEEVNRLPAKYRAPFVLCYFDGKTNEEAARELGCPKGTILSRLAWARQRLRTRLTGRGLVLSGWLLSAAAGRHAAEAGVPAMLMGSTLRAALLVADGQTTAVGSTQVAILTQGVLRTMLSIKVKIALTCVLLVGVLGIVGGVVARQSMPDKPNAGPLASALRAKSDRPESSEKTPQPSQPQDKGPRAQPGLEEKTYAFEMVKESWSKVVEWYSDISGLPFTGKDLPVGNFSYTPPKNKKYTLREITDILNEALLQSKYHLIRGDASFTLVPADQRLDPTFLPRVRLEDLSKRSKTDLVTVLVPVGNLNAKELAPDIKKLTGPFGEVIVLEKTNQLLLADSPVNLLSIYKAIQELEAAPKKKIP
jgi:RNA polymerase sigma factor (sigma-70 family)